ncbi:MAG: hypothetical protein ACOY3P_00090 [Planctomycetota bacterium]
MKRQWLVLAAVVFSVSAEPVWAEIYLTNPSPARHDRFYTGADGAFLAEGYDLSGVGRVDATGSSSRWVTMISDTYFLSANHYAPANGSTVSFYLTNDPNGAVETRTVVSGSAIPGGDLYLGTLSAPVSSSVAKYPVLSLPSWTSYDGLEMFTLGLSVPEASATDTSVRVGRNAIEQGGVGLQTVSGVPGVASVFDYNNPSSLGGDESYLFAGDSGAPSFAIVDGSLALVGIHWFNRGNTAPGEGFPSGDTFVPAYVGLLNAAMSGEQITVVPEPSMLALLACAGAGLALAGWRRRVNRPAS